MLRWGRVKPLDSVARNTLLVLRNKRTALDAEEEKVPAIDWLAQVLFEPEKADQLKTFLIDHDQLLGLIGKKLAEHGKHYSYSQLEPFLSQIETTAREAGKTEQEKRDSFDQNVLDLYRGLLLYRKLKHTLAPPPVPPESLESLREMEVEQYFFDPQKDPDRTAEYRRFRELTQSISEDPATIRMGGPDFAKVVFFVDHYSRANLWSEFFPVPPQAGDPKRKWLTVGQSLVGEEPLESSEKRKMAPVVFMDTLRELVALPPDQLRNRIASIRANQKMNPTALFATQYAEAIKLRTEVDPVLGLYENLGIAYRTKDFTGFNNTVAELRKIGVERAGEEASTLSFEKAYNGFEPFTEVPSPMFSSSSLRARHGSSPQLPVPPKRTEGPPPCFGTPPSTLLPSFSLLTLSAWRAGCTSRVAHLSPTSTVPPSSSAGARSCSVLRLRNSFGWESPPRWGP